MNKQIKIFGTVSLVVAIALLVTGYFADDPFWQPLLISLSTTILGFGIALFVVNHILMSADKKAAADPLVKLILPNIRRLHNDLFIRHLMAELGAAQMEEWLKTYSRHKADPKAFSPEQRDKLYEVIKLRENDLKNVYESLQEQLRELTLLLGWSFDSKIMSDAFSARLSMATFLASSWDDEVPTKLSIIEAYLDIEADTQALFKKLMYYVGIDDSEWQESIANN